MYCGGRENRLDDDPTLGIEYNLPQHVAQECLTLGDVVLGVVEPQPDALTPRRKGNFEVLTLVPVEPLLLDLGEGPLSLALLPVEFCEAAVHHILGELPVAMGLQPAIPLLLDAGQLAPEVCPLRLGGAFGRELREAAIELLPQQLQILEPRADGRPYGPSIRSASTRGRGRHTFRSPTFWGSNAVQA